MVGFSLVLIKHGHWSLWMASASLSGSRPGWVSGGAGEMHEDRGAARQALYVPPNSDSQDPESHVRAPVGVHEFQAGARGCGHLEREWREAIQE